MENKKCLYWRRFSRTINGDKYPIYTKLEYGVMPNDEKLEYKTFDELWESRNDFSCYGIECRKPFSKRKVRMLLYSTMYGRDKQLKETDFKSACFETKYDKCTVGYSIKKLSEQLTADMFFDYCIDNMSKKGYILIKEIINDE